MLSSILSHMKRVLSPDWCRYVPDTTPKHGNKRAEVERILNLMMWGLLSGKRDLRDIETQSELEGERISDSTLRGVLRRLSPKELPKLIASQVKQALESKELCPDGLPCHQVSFDGKNRYMERALKDKDGNQKSVHERCHMALRATLVSSEVTQILGERPIPHKSAETTEFVPFLDEIEELYGRTSLLKLISVDAGMTHKKNATVLTERGYWYMMALKENQPEALRVAERITEGRPSCAETVEHHSGKEVVRTLTVGSLEGRLSEWSHATEVWKVEQVSTHRTTQEVCRETRFFIVSVPRGQFTPKQKLKAVRNHWHIENNAFWTLDACFNEDKCPFATVILDLVSLLRIMAFNLLARLRGRRLKSKANRALRWNDYFTHFFAAFCITYCASQARDPTV